jgi:hypothetical protein
MDHADPAGSLARAASLAQKIASILEGESSETRTRVCHAALALLGDTSAASAELLTKAPGISSNAPENLLENAESLKPADAVYLCAAHHFSCYGNATFTPDDLRKIGLEAGFVLPDRIDMTLKGAGKKGKRLFQSAGKGVFRPTAAAGAFFRDRWNIKPGKTAKP